VKRYFNHKFNRKIYELFAGNYFATGEEDVVLTTLLGSCVSACMYDERNQVVGMNHFLLPGDFRREEIIFSPSSKYGLHAMEMLINSMMKLGAQRKNLRAKIFGGGHVLSNTGTQVPENNVNFIKAFLHMEEIPIISEDVGGNMGRKILFFSRSHTVYLKRVQPQRVYQQDKKLLNKVKKDRDKAGDVTLFD